LKRYQFQKNTLLGSPLSKEFQHIIGGGISALLLGFQLKQHNIPFKIYEKSNRLGGLLESYWCEYGLVESSANGFLWNQEMQDMCDALGLDIMPPSQKSKARFLIRNKAFKRVPVGIGDMLSASFKLFRKSDFRPETIEDFGEAYFGNKVTRNVLEPALMGIYGAGVGELSFPAVLPSFARSLNDGNSIGLGLWKKRFGSNTKKKASGTHSFKNGMQELIDRLGEYLKEYIVLEHEIVDLPKVGSVILCTPMSTSNKFLQSETGLSIEYPNYASMLSCNVFVEKTKIPKRKNGFGCLVPRNEDLNLLGVLYNDCIFENRVHNAEHANLTCMLRDFSGSFERKTDQEIQALVEKELGVLLGLKGSVLRFAVKRWKEAIPIYSPLLYESRFELHENLKAQNSRIRLFGNYTGQISVRGMSEEALKIVSAIV